MTDETIAKKLADTDQVGRLAQRWAASVDRAAFSTTYTITVDTDHQDAERVLRLAAEQLTEALDDGAATYRVELHSAANPNAGYLDAWDNIED